MKLVSLKELMDILFTTKSKPSIKTIYRRVADGTIPCTRIAGRLFFDVVEVRETLKKLNTGVLSKVS